MSVHPTPGSRRFGEIVNKHREEAKITRATLAQRIFITPSFAGRIIKGTSRCKLENAEKMDEVLHANGKIIAAWRKHIENSDLPRALTEYSEVETTATLLRSVQTMYIDGLLQTPEYAKVLAATEKGVAERLERQKILERLEPPLLCAILDESVLYRRVGSTAVMREQLESVLELGQRKHIRIQIALFSSYDGLSVNAPYALATQADLSVLGFQETTSGGETARDDNTLSLLTNLFAKLQTQALNVEDSRAFIRRAIEERWT
ncbi:helix-turn-helix domain-containing protein [Actinomadura hibisca]|uniref:helix-turn-helix domain-containing protein n=1 Tax=Actinomadura hibisca TaxID=68565 RepID=UPI00083169A7|nr:helix-turn-helix transcriptional regulator [Actinomadura hibisca]